MTLSGVELLQYIEGRDAAADFSDFDEEDEFERIGADDFGDEEEDSTPHENEEIKDTSTSDGKDKQSIRKDTTIFFTNAAPALTYVKREAVPEDTMCEFCYDSLITDRRNLFLRLPCSRILCKNCLDAHIDANLSLQGIRDTDNHIYIIRKDNCIELKYSPFCIKCPYLNCKCCITQDMLKNYNYAKAARFEKLAYLSMKLTNPDLTYCPFCNNEGNECYPVKKGPLEGQQCVKCSLVHCKKCRRDPHPGFSCKRRNFKRLLKLAEWQRYPLLHKEEIYKRIFSTIKFDWRECPHCKEFVEKNGGCDHMYCTKCRKSFDWGTALQFSKLTIDQLFSCMDSDFLVRFLPPVPLHFKRNINISYT